MNKKRFSANGVVMKVDPELKKIIDNVATNNKVSRRVASLKIAKMYKMKMEGVKFNDEIIF
jgi:hypothetical protein